MYDFVVIVKWCRQGKTTLPPRSASTVDVKVRFYKNTKLTNYIKLSRKKSAFCTASSSRFEDVS